MAKLALTVFEASFRICSSQLCGTPMWNIEDMKKASEKYKKVNQGKTAVTKLTV